MNLLKGFLIGLDWTQPVSSLIKQDILGTHIIAVINASDVGKLKRAGVAFDNESVADDQGRIIVDIPKCEAARASKILGIKLK